MITLLTVNAASNQFGVSPLTIRSWIKRHLISKVKVFESTLVDEAEIRDYLTAKRRGRGFYVGKAYCPPPRNGDGLTMKPAVCSPIYRAVEAASKQARNEPQDLYPPAEMLNAAPRPKHKPISDAPLPSNKHTELPRYEGNPTL